MTRERYRALQRLYIEFDRSTAYGCALRGVPFSRRRMAETWTAYVEVLDGVLLHLPEAPPS